MGRGWRLAALAALLLAAGPVLAAEYPAASARTIEQACLARKEVPQATAAKICACYAQRVQENIAWEDWISADAALAAKGKDALDPASQATFQKAVDAAAWCVKQNNH